MLEHCGLNFFPSPGWVKSFEFLVSSKLTWKSKVWSVFSVCLVIDVFCSTGYLVLVYSVSGLHIKSCDQRLPKFKVFCIVSVSDWL